MIVNELTMFENDFLYFQQELKNLRKQYPNRFIAVHNGKIIGSEPSFDELKKELEKKELDVSKVVIEFVPEEETFMVL